MSAAQARALQLAQDGQGEKLAALLAQDDAPSVDFVDGAGLSPLMYAAREDHVEAVEALLQGAVSRASIDFQSPVDQRTALHWAAFYGALDTLETLMRAGADVQLRDQSGLSVVDQAEVHEDSLSDAHAVRSAVHSVMSSLANPVDLDQDEPPSQEADAEEEQQQEEEAGADNADGDAEPAEQDEEPELSEADLLLHDACRSGNADFALQALDGGAEPDRADDTGMTPLMLAAAGGYLELVRILIEEASANRDAQHPRSGSHTALMFAILHGQVECVSWMIREGGCAVYGPVNLRGEAADQIEPQEKVTRAEMEHVIEEALRGAERQQQQQQQGGGGDRRAAAATETQQEDDLPQDAEQGQPRQSGRSQADQAEDRAAEARYIQQQEEEHARLEQEAQQQQRAPAREYDPQDAHAFSSLPFSEAVTLLITRYRRACSDANQPPLAFLEAALAHIMHGRALLLSGADCTARSDKRLDDLSLAPLLELLAHNFAGQVPLLAWDLSFNHLSERSVPGLGDFVASNGTLTSLDLSGNDIGAAGGIELARVLLEYAPPTLVKLNVSSNPLGSSALVAFADLVASNRSALTELNLGNTDCDQVSLLKLSTALQSARGLKRLNLDNPLLNQHYSGGQETTIHLARSLALNAGLTSLSLKGHGITDQSASWLAEFLLPNQSLTELDLRRNKLSTTGVALFVKPLAHRRVECVIPLDGNLLRGQVFHEIEDAIAEQRGARNTVSFTSRLEKQTLRAKGPL